MKMQATEWLGCWNGLVGLYLELRLRAEEGGARRNKHGLRETSVKGASHL